MKSLIKMMIIKKNKKASLLHQIIMHLILIGLIFGMFFVATTARANSRTVKQQVLEKQIALLIDSAIPGMEFGIYKINRNGFVNDIELRDGRVFVLVDGLSFGPGYPYFSKHDVSVEFVSGESEVDNKFVVRVE